MNIEVMGRCDHHFRKQLRYNWLKQIRKTSSFVADIDMALGEILKPVHRGILCCSQADMLV